MTTSDETRPATSPAFPSGAQWSIEHGPYRATIVEVGGALRELTHDGQPIVRGYEAHQKADAARGNLLVPWPNRIRDGRYTFEGRELQLPLNEVERRIASHGLGRWANWSLVNHESNEVTVGLTIHPSQGWEWTLRVEVTYRLDDDGLRVTPVATNLSDSACPFGFGAHPYLTCGEQNLDETTATARVSTQVTLDERLLPVGTEPARHDFSDGLNLTGVDLDVCYTDPQPLPGDPAGVWSVVLAGPAGRTRLWADAEGYPYLQMFTGDGLPAPRTRTGLAVEPMTCPADAFNSGENLIVLQPGQRWSAPFGIQFAS